MASTTGRYGRAAATLAVLGLLIGACGDARDPGGEGTPEQVTEATPPPEGPATGEPTSRPTEEPTDVPTAGSDPTDPAEVEAAVADLAEHLGIAVEDITVVSYEDVTWPDGALGCPAPGMAYTQALVPGARLVLEAEGRQYHYHAGREPDLVRCDHPLQQPADTG